MRFLGATLVVLAVAGCFAAERDEWEQQWKNREGRSVPAEVLTAYRGPEHCDWESTVFLSVGWPLGTRAPNVGRARQYVRDPEGKFAGHLRSRYDSDAELPRKARYTGYHLDDVELWISPSDSSKAVYLVYTDRVERWPRTKGLIACA